VTDDGPFAACDGHDFPGLIDEGVPGIAAVIDDVVEGFENTVRQPFCRTNYQIFSWLLSSGARDGSCRSDMLLGLQ
jgi:hypothetical protein